MPYPVDNKKPGFSKKNEERALLFGQACRHLFMTERKSYSLASAYLWVWPAICLEQIVYISDQNGLWLGYATWAFLSKDDSNSYMMANPSNLELYEWNEGTDLWIIDFVCINATAYKLARSLKNRLSSDYSSVKRLVRDATGLPVSVRNINMYKGRLINTLHI